MKYLLTRVLDLLSPRTCVVCGRRLGPTERSICSVCLLHLPRTRYQQTPDDNPMARLFWGLTPVERAAALMFYHPNTDTTQLVLELKYHQRPDIGEDMGRIMATEMQAAGFFYGIDVLLPVPLTRQRQRQRGYNQSEQLARGISQITRIPIDCRAVARRDYGESQTRLSHYERRENVEGSFVLCHPDRLAHRHVLLVDDVCTTGATLTALSDTIKDIAGIRISILTLGFTK